MTMPRRGLVQKIACILLVPLALLVASCGNTETRTDGEEGEFVHAGDAVYQVQLTG